MSKSPAEYISDFLLGFLPSLLPAPLNDAAKSTIDAVRGPLEKLLSQPRLQSELLEVARRAESNFRAKARANLKSDELVQAVASFPLYDHELFQKSLAKLPDNLNEEVLAENLQDIITSDWKGKFTPDELRAGIAIYLNCLRVELLQIEGFADIVTRLAILRVDQRAEETLLLVQDLVSLVNRLLENILARPITVTTTLFTIPSPVEDFTGRENELGQIKANFSRGVLITGISGSGGIGKTELAYKLADEIKDYYPDARLTIDLLGTSETPLPPAEAMRRLLEPFYPNQQLPQSPEQLRGLYHETFSSRKALLLLDNAKSAQQVRALIAPHPSAVIITSRNHFSLTEFGLKETVRLNVLSPESARELLQSLSGTIADSSNAKVNGLAQLCGYLPLAIRVAAALLSDRQDWTIDHLLNRLRDERGRLRLLKRPDDPDFDVEAAISLSYNLLSAYHQKLFRSLGCLPTQFWHISAAQMWKISNNQEVDDLIGYFINHNLLNNHIAVIGLGENPGSAYSMHDLTRLFAMNRLLENADEAREALQLYAEYCFFVAITVLKEFHSGSGNLSVAINLFRASLPQFLIGWRRMLPNQDVWPRPTDADQWLASFPSACIDLLNITTSSTLLVSILEDSLQAARRINHQELERRILGNLGNSYMMSGYLDKAIAYYEQLLGNQREVGDRAGEGLTLGNLSTAYSTRGEPDKAIEFCKQALVIASELQDLRNAGGWYINLGRYYSDTGDYEQALAHIEQGLSIHRKIGEKIGETRALLVLSDIYARMGDSKRAVQYDEDALLLSRQISNVHDERIALGSLAIAYSDLGELEKAKLAAEACLVIDREFEDPIGLGKTLALLGIINFKMGDHKQAISYMEETIGIYELIDHPDLKFAQNQLMEMQGASEFEKLIRDAIRAWKHQDPTVSNYFAIVSKIARDPAAPPEIQELGKILQRILIGVQKVDLSTLPKELAQLIQEELESTINLQSFD
jgi:tetratricopeptide (TPR) repeat protein